MHPRPPADPFAAGYIDSQSPLAEGPNRYQISNVPAEYAVTGVLHLKFHPSCPKNRTGRIALRTPGPCHMASPEVTASNLKGLIGQSQPAPSVSTGCKSSLSLRPSDLRDPTFN